MQDKDDWITTSGKYNGKLVVWIDQSTDGTLLAANSRGVCFALTRDWVRNYTRNRIDRYNFVNSFRTGDGAVSRIPQAYIDSQLSLAAQYKVSSIAFITATREAIKSGQLDTAEGKQRINVFRKQQYGPECINYFDFKNDGTNPIGDVLDFVFLEEEVGSPVPQYVMLSMKGTTGGHVVGFEMRPDVYVSANYPMLYEFFDANLGLFAFSNYTDVRNFFQKEVWEKLYKDNYTKLGAAVFDTGLGGLGEKISTSILQYLTTNAQRMLSRLWD